LGLVEKFDILVENFKPGTMEKWGLGPEILQKKNPKLTVVRISGWGQTGPWSHKPGFGSLVEAMSGFAAMNGFEDRPPVLPPLAMADMIAGLYGAFSIMVAVREVEQKNGQGQIIDLSLFEPILSILGPMSPYIPYQTKCHHGQVACQTPQLREMYINVRMESL
jgi:formyl-CoA transferase